VELLKKKNSKYWWYDFTVRGKRFRGSTKETNEGRARKIAALKFADACEKGDPLPRKAPTLLVASGRFLEWVGAARLSERTKTYYQDGWRLLKTTSILGMRLDAINNDVAERLNFTGSAANTNCALRTLRRLLHKAEDWKLIGRAPKIRLITEKERSLRLDDEAERKLLTAAAQCNWRPRTRALFRDIVILVRETGMRNEKELYQIRIENIDWDRHIVFVPDSKTISGIREVPLSNRAFEILRRRSGECKEGWVFPSKRSAAGHMTTMAVKFRQARKKAGLPKKLVLYCGRHDFGTRLLKETGNLKLVMQTMGHVDTKTALKYQHPELEIVRSALNRTEPEWRSNGPSGPAMARFTAHTENSIGV
jgi:site-specific recombinase XerD